MLQTVVAGAAGTMYRLHERGINQRLAARVRALLVMREDTRFRGERGLGSSLLSTSSGPGAGVGTTVCGFGAVIEAEFAESAR